MEIFRLSGDISRILDAQKSVYNRKLQNIQFGDRFVLLRVVPKLTRGQFFQGKTFVHTWLIYRLRL